MMEEHTFDWAQAAANLFRSHSTDINELARAAQLNPFDGDLSDADLTGLDLTNQDLSNWDLRDAVFREANLTNTNLQGAKFNYMSLAEAHNWEKAILEENVVEQVSLATILKTEITEYFVNYRIYRVLKETDITLLGDLVHFSESDLLKISEFGYRSLEAVQNALDDYKLHLGMKIEFWPEERIKKVLENPRYLKFHTPRMKGHQDKLKFQQNHDLL